MSCPEDRRPTRIPRPTPPGSHVDAGRNIGLSPHSPLAWGSRIPRISSYSTRRRNLNESFTIPERRARTLSPRMRDPVVMRTTEQNVNYDEWPERIPRLAGQNTVPERREVTMSPRIPNYEGCLPTPQVVSEDSTPTSRPRNRRQHGINRRLDMAGACEENMEPGEADLNTTAGTYYSANAMSDSDCEDDEFVMADEFEPVSEFEHSPGPSPPPRGPSGRRRWVKTAGCLPTWGLRIADMAESSSTPPPQKRAARPVSGTSEEQTPCLDLQERSGISCSDQDSGGAGCSPEEDDEWADWEDPGGIADVETPDDFDRRHQDLIDSFRFPEPSLRPMAGCRVDPRPGESPRSFLRRNYQAIDQFWQAAQRNPLPQMSPVDYSYSSQELQQAHARLAQQIAMGPTEQDFMNLMPSDDDDCSPPQELQQAHARLAQQIAMGPTEQDFMDLMPSDDDDCSPPQELQQAHARLAQQIAMGPTEQDFMDLMPSDDDDCSPPQELKQAHARLAMGPRQQDFMGSPPSPPMPRQRMSPSDTMRRRALANSQHRQSANEDFFGIGMDDDCPPPSPSPQASRSPSPCLPTISKDQGPPRPPSPVRRPSPLRSESSRGKSRSGVNSCVPSNVADIIHGYGSV